MFLCTHAKNIFAHTDTDFCSADTLLTEGHKNIFYFHTHGMTQNWLHAFTRIYTEKFSRKGAKGAERYVLLFLCQKSLHTELHRILFHCYSVHSV